MIVNNSRNSSYSRDASTSKSRDTNNNRDSGTPTCIRDAGNRNATVGKPATAVTVTEAA
jgi:hypothetical protein